jgi:hypothetical protein
MSRKAQLALGGIALAAAAIALLPLYMRKAEPQARFGALSASFIQSTTCNGNASPLNTTNFSGSVTAGSIIVVTTVDDGGTGSTVTGVTDTGGNTYANIASTGGNNSGAHMVWWARATTGGSNFHVTVTWDTAHADRATCVAQEFGPWTGTPTLDKVSAYAAASSNSPLSATSGTLSNAEELVVGSFAHYATASAFSLGSTYSNLGTVNQANAAVAQESKVVSATTAVTAGASIAASREWSAYVVTFYDAGGGGGGSTPPPVAGVCVDDVCN